MSLMQMLFENEQFGFILLECEFKPSIMFHIFFFMYHGISQSILSLKKERKRKRKESHTFIGSTRRWALGGMCGTGNSGMAVMIDDFKLITILPLLNIQ